MYVEWVVEVLEWCGCVWVGGHVVALCTRLIGRLIFLSFAHNVSIANNISTG